MREDSRALFLLSEILRKGDENEIRNTLDEKFYIYHICIDFIYYRWRGYEFASESFGI